MNLVVTTVVLRYSMEPGEVGKPIGTPDEVQHTDGAAALLHMEAEMQKPDSIRDGRRFIFRFPDGAEMPFNAAYERIFGEPPVRRDNRPTLYPHLKKARATGRRTK